MKINMRFFKHPLFILAVLFLFPPAGLILMWVEGVFTKQMRMGITAVIFILYVFGQDRPDDFSFSQKLIKWLEPTTAVEEPVAAENLPTGAAQPAPAVADDQISVGKNPVESSSGTSEAPIDTSAFVQVKVKRVVDGDTIITEDGTKVRLIGINTPESTKETEPYGKDASNYTKGQLLGKTVWLEKDVSETDQYGRALRIVWTDLPSSLSDDEIRLKMFNASLVINGYAEPYTFPPDVKYADYFKTFAREAREKTVGLWAIDPVNGTTKGDLDE